MRATATHVAVAGEVDHGVVGDRVGELRAGRASQHGDVGAVERGELRVDRREVVGTAVHEQGRPGSPSALDGEGSAVQHQCRREVGGGDAVGHRARRPTDEARPTEHLDEAVDVEGGPEVRERGLQHHGTRCAAAGDHAQLDTLAYRPGSLGDEGLRADVMRDHLAAVAGEHDDPIGDVVGDEAGTGGHGAADAAVEVE